MTYHEALDFWFRRVDFELKTPQAADLRLDRIRRLLELLGNPQDRLTIFHLAGSKGKGSTSAMLASMYRQGGYRVGLFTSPHLVQVAERIQIDGLPISNHDLTNLLMEIKTVSQETRSSGETLAASLTFFEIATALGFLHFARQQVDVAVIEVGLGGRFDATNVCQPRVSIITSISFDHVQVLGATLSAIAREKAGIIKPGRQVVSGVVNLEARAVIQAVCAERNAPLRELGRDFQVEYRPAPMDRDREAWPQASIQLGQLRYDNLSLGLLGEHQAVNAALAVAAVETMKGHGLPLSDEALRDGLKMVHWPARLEIVGRDPLVVLDCAHNVASIEALVKTLRTSLVLSPGGRRWLIFAGSKDKDLSGMLAVLGGYFDQVLLTRFGSVRAAGPEDLCPALPSSLVDRWLWFPSADLALEQVRSHAGPADLVCITGSVFLAGELRPRLVKSANDPVA